MSRWTSTSPPLLPLEPHADPEYDVMLDLDRIEYEASEALTKLLPADAGGDLASVCSWANEVRFQFRWSAPLHFINTLGMCNFNYASVDVDAATKHKIKVARIPGSATGNSTSCAEMAIYLILGLLRKQVGFNLLCYNRPLAIIGYNMFMRSIHTCCFTYCQPFHYFLSSVGQGRISEENLFSVVLMARKKEKKNSELLLSRGFILIYNVRKGLAQATECFGDLVTF